MANDAFNSDIAEGANRAAIHFMHAVRERGGRKHFFSDNLTSPFHPSVFRPQTRRA